MPQRSSGDTVLLLSDDARVRTGSGCRIQEWQSYRADRDRGGGGTEATIRALCLAGMNHAHNAAKPRMPRFGTEQMRYMRSRPWRPRGPWFDNRAGARRRGRRADELVAAVAEDLQVHESVASAGVDVVEAEDVLLSGAPAWPILERMPAAWLAHQHASSLAPNGPGHDRALQPNDQLLELEAEAVFTAHMLSSQSDDSANSDSSSRQSA
jgi:hypothetical protein